MFQQEWDIRLFCHIEVDMCHPEVIVSKKWCISTHFVHIFASSCVAWITWQMFFFLTKVSDTSDASNILPFKTHSGSLVILLTYFKGHWGHEDIDNHSDSILFERQCEINANQGGMLISIDPLSRKALLGWGFLEVSSYIFLIKRYQREPVRSLIKLCCIFELKILYVYDFIHWILPGLYTL